MGLVPIARRKPKEFVMSHQDQNNNRIIKSVGGVDTDFGCRVVCSWPFEVVDIKCRDFDGLIEGLIQIRNNLREQVKNSIHDDVKFHVILTEIEP